MKVSYEGYLKYVIITYPNVETVVTDVRKLVNFNSIQGKRVRITIEEIKEPMEPITGHIPEMATV